MLTTPPPSDRTAQGLATPGQRTPPKATPSYAAGGKSTPGASPRLSPGEGKLLGGNLPEKRGERRQLLGKGGFGEVWRVRYLNSEEAWKYLPKMPGNDLQAFREALNARSINHPNVVRIIDIEEDENYYIIRTDLIRGTDLQRTIGERGVLTPETACRFAIQVADTLEAAHRVGVLHLDLKPANLILKDDGTTVMITDFGISATMGHGLFDLATHNLQSTPFFQVPELLQGGESGSSKPGPWTDIWAMGITFYYLLSWNYPFPFQERGPSCILTEAPRPLPEMLPYISDALWSILERMLRRDPGDRFQTMGEVRTAFKSYLDEIVCSACKQTFPVEHVRGICPNDECPHKERVVEYLRKRSLMRSGHEFFARCEHERAVECYKKALELEDGKDTDFNKRVHRLIMIAEADHQELTQRLVEVQAFREEGDLLAIVKGIDSAPHRFSAAQRLRTLREGAVKAILECCDRVGEEVRKLVIETRFADAKRLLTKNEVVRGYELIGKAIKELESKENRRFEKVEDLFNFVQELENYFLDLKGKLTKAVGEYDLRKAVDCLQQLDRRFPDPRNKAKARLYSDLNESLEAIRKCDAEAVRKALESGGEKPPSLSGELKKIVESCDKTLGILRSEGFLALVDEVADRKSAIEREIGTILVRKGELQARMESERGENHPREELLALEGLLAIAEATDLIPPEEAGPLRKRQSGIRQIVDRAERRYREGCALLERKNYQAAQLEFEAAGREGEGVFQDIRDKIEECQELAEKEITLINQVDGLYNRIMGDEVAIEDFKSYFQLLKQIPRAQETDTRLEWDQKTLRVLARLLSMESERLSSTSDTPDRLTVLSEASSVLLTVSEDWLSSCFTETSSELNERFLEFFGRFFAPLERGRVLPRMMDQRLDILRGTVTEMVLLKPILRRLKPLQYQTHPAEKASGAILGCRVAALVGPESFERLGTLLSLHDELKDLVDDPITARILGKNQRTLRNTRTGIQLKRLLHRFYQNLKVAFVPLATALVVGVGFYTYSLIEVQKYRVSSAQEIVRSIFGEGVAIPDEKLKVVREGGLARFLEPLLVLGPVGSARNEDPPSDPESLVGWMELQKAKLDCLNGFVDLENKESPSNKVIGERKKEILNKANRCLSALLDKIAKDALTIDPAQESSFHLKKAERELAAFVRLAGLGEEGTDDATKPARVWLEWISKFNSSLSNETPYKSDAKDGLSGSLNRLTHLAKISQCTRELIWNSREIYRTEGNFGGASRKKSEGGSKDFITSAHELLETVMRRRGELADVRVTFASSDDNDPIRKGIQDALKSYLEAP